MNIYKRIYPSDPSPFLFLQQRGNGSCQRASSSLRLARRPRGLNVLPSSEKKHTTMTTRACAPTPPAFPALGMVSLIVPMNRIWPSGLRMLCAGFFPVPRPFSHCSPLRGKTESYRASPSLIVSSPSDASKRPMRDRVSTISAPPFLFPEGKADHTFAFSF